MATLELRWKLHSTTSVMLITNVTDLDKVELERIHDGSFPFPDLTDTIAKECVIDNGILVGMGIVRLTTEGILIIDRTLTTPTKVRAIRRLIEDLSLRAKILGVKDCHVFIKEDKMHKFLTEIGFRDCFGRA